MALIVGAAYVLTRPGVVETISEIAKDKIARDAMIDIALDIARVRAFI